MEESRRYLLCVSFWCPHFSLYRNKKDITEFSNVCYSIRVCFQKWQEFGRRFPIHSNGDIFNFGSVTAPAYVQPEKLFTFVSSFSPLTFKLLQIFILLPIQLLHTFSFMFSWRNCSAIKLFTFLSSFSPLNYQLFCLSAFEKFSFFCKFLTIQPC